MKALKIETTAFKSNIKVDELMIVIVITNFYFCLQ